MKRSMKEVPNSMFMPRGGALPNSLRVEKSPMRKRIKIGFYNFIGCLVAVRDFKIFLRLIRFLQLGCINGDFLRFTPALLLTK